MGPVDPKDGIISKGRMMRLAQKIPRGGIHAVLRICPTVIVDSDTYSTQALQNMVRTRLIQGATTQPRRAKRIWESDGKYRAMTKLKRVRITAWTTPNVIRMA